MKRSLALILLIAVSLCGSNHLVCQIFNSNEKSLQQYCDEIPRNCSSDINSTIHSSQVNHLEISGCDAKIVLDSAQIFEGNLRVLDLSYSGFKSLQWFDLKLAHLQIFNASHNGLADLWGSPFGKFPEIVEIDLSYNNLSSVNHGLMDIPKLRRLHLSHNNFAYAVMKNFPLQSIEYIDLSSNKIAFLLAVPYNQYKSLTELHLEENPYHSIECDLLEGMFHGRLTSLYITWKTVTSFWGHCADKFRVKKIRIVRINDTSSEGIFFTSNGTYEAHCEDKCFENVAEFDAGYNVFQNGNDVIQNFGSRVDSNNLSGNFIGELSAGAFDRFTELSTLALSATNLTWFDFDMLRSQKDTIHYVDISNNNLKDLRNIQLLPNYKLRELIVGGNQIENAHEVIKYVHSSIKNLDLSGGTVGKVNDTTFQRLIELKQLNLSNTNLILPNSNPFEVLQKLEMLDLSYNNLENFDFSILSATLHSLTVLSVAGCRIKDIFAFGTVIQYLGPNLSSLDLSRNAVYGDKDSSNFELDSLKHQRKLESLDISYNKLKTVDFKSFPFEENIHINLEGNDLIDLTNLQKRPFNRIITLKLANNQFPCDYLKQFKTDYVNKISLAGEAWHQKPDRDCRKLTDSVKDFMMNVYEKIVFW